MCVCVCSCHPMLIDRGEHIGMSILCLLVIRVNFGMYLLGWWEREIASGTEMRYY